MTIIPEDIKNTCRFKQNVKNIHKCPICKQKIEIGVELTMIKKLSNKEKGIYSHLIIHGKPLHALICYIDSHMSVRGIMPIESIEISRDSDTFQELMKKWANPY